MPAKKITSKKKTTKKRKRSERHWTYDTFAKFWVKWIELPNFPLGAAKLARKLPPLHLWELACENYLKKRMPRLDEKNANEEMQRAILLLELREYPDPKGVRPRALLRIVPLLNDDRQRMMLYLSINEKIVPQNRPKTSDLFLTIFSKESAAFQMKAFSKLNIKAEFFRPIGQYIIGLANGSIKPGHRFGFFKMRKIKKLANKIAEDSKCFVCYRPLKPREKDRGRCESCSRKTFSKWARKIKKMRKSKCMIKREKLFLTK